MTDERIERVAGAIHKAHVEATHPWWHADAYKCRLSKEIAKAAIEAMDQWQPIETAPKEGTVIKVQTAGGLIFRASWQGGLVNESENECFGWLAEDEAGQPDCWSDGVCWAENADGKKSDQPTHWEPLHEPPAEGT